MLPNHLPPVQYGDLARTSRLPQQQLRAGLLVLIQHNYVNVYLKQVSGGSLGWPVLACYRKNSFESWHLEWTLLACYRKL